MSRVQEIEQTRVDVAKLAEEFGLLLKDRKGKPLIDKVNELKVARTILTPPKTVYPCSAELKGLGLLDPCLIVPPSLPVELMPKHKAIAVGGQVLSVSRSMYAMSPYMMEEAARFQGFANGQPLPMLVSIRGNYNYLVPQRALFFKYESFVGSDIDPLSPMDPDPINLKLNRYFKGDDLSGELTLIVAEY